jgi:hypothetical protein
MEGLPRISRITVALLLGVLVAEGSPGPSALAVTRWDHRYDAYVDVWRTSKNRVVIAGAPDRLRLDVIATLSNDWALSVYLDTRGDGSADYRLVNFEKFGIGRCRLWRLSNGDRRPVRCGRHYIDGDVPLLARLWWSVPRPWLRSDKVIRWHVHTHDVGFDPRGRHDDRAPDRGWYP